MHPSLAPAQAGALLHQTTSLHTDGLPASRGVAGSDAPVGQPDRTQAVFFYVEIVEETPGGMPVPSDFGITPAVPALFKIVAALMVCGFLFTIGMIILIIRMLITTHANNRLQPVIDRPARVVAKRTDVSGGGEYVSAYTSYYATFEFDSGNREELGVSGREYAILAEGDVGTLHSQGAWFKGFDRQRS